MRPPMDLVNERGKLFHNRSLQRALDWPVAWLVQEFREQHKDDAMALDWAGSCSCKGTLQNGVSHPIRPPGMRVQEESRLGGMFFPGVDEPKDTQPFFQERLRNTVKICGSCSKPCAGDSMGRLVRLGFCLQKSFKELKGSCSIQLP